MRNIFISLSPNVEKEDRRLAWRMLWRPWQWKRGEAIQRCEQWFKDYFGASYAWSVNSGRSGLFLILQAFGIGKGDEVLLQAFTCNAVPNPVLWVGATPIYVDIEEDSLNIDPVDLERKITDKARAVIVQHTFGFPADMDRILTLAEKYNLIVIEDCAHALGATYHGKKVGTLGDVSFFSFGRDKVISSVYGGMIITKSDVIARRIEAIYKDFRYPSLFWIKQQLLHPIVMEWVIRWYTLGKFLLVALQKLHLLSLAVHPKEKVGERPYYFPRRLPNALAALAVSQLQRLERFNAHRRKIARVYASSRACPVTIPPASGLVIGVEKYLHLQSQSASEAIFLRYTIRHPEALTILKTAKREGIYLGDWYTSVIAPPDTNLETMGYVPGSCPRAERLSKEALNLPTHIRITEEDAQRIVEVLDGPR